MRKRFDSFFGGNEAIFKTLSAELRVAKNSNVDGNGVARLNY